MFSLWIKGHCGVYGEPILKSACASLDVQNDSDLCCSHMLENACFFVVVPDKRIIRGFVRRSI